MQVNDAGGSIVIHIFGAYFGLTISKIIYEEGTVGNPKECPNYHSDIFSVIGNSDVHTKILNISLTLIFSRDDISVYVLAEL